jgi:hypothetical protein
VPADLIFWLALATKLAVTAGFVVFATWTAERAGPLIGAMVVTLPVSAGPSYVFLALDHDARFIAASALASLISNAGTVLFCAVYTVAAQSRSLAASLSAALGTWIVFVVAVQALDLTMPGVLSFNAATFLVGLPVIWRLRQAPVRPFVRRWYDIPLRAGMVAALVGTVVGLSSTLGPTTTGILALFPIVLTSVTLILHRRLGGPATAAITANSIPGLAGFCLALVALHLLPLRIGTPLALAFSLSVPLAWNLMLFGVSRYVRARSAAATSLR